MGAAMPARHTMTGMFGGLVQRLQHEEVSGEKKRESTIAKIIAVGFGLLWAVVIWLTMHGS
jgi:hypothetical protein